MFSGFYTSKKCSACCSRSSFLAVVVISPKNHKGASLDYTNTENCSQLIKTWYGFTDFTESLQFTNHKAKIIFLREVLPH